MFLPGYVSERTQNCPFLVVHVFAAGGSSMYQQRHCNHSSTSREHPVEIERIEEGRDMDRGSWFLQIPRQGETTADACHSCAIVQLLAGQTPSEESAFTIEGANDGALVLRQPDVAGLVVVPRRCVTGLQELPVAGRGHVLAAVRMATLLVRSENLEGTSRIEVMRDSSTPACHVSYQVVPDHSDSLFRSDRQRSQLSPQFAHP